MPKIWIFPDAWPGLLYPAEGASAPRSAAAAARLFRGYRQHPPAVRCRDEHIHKGLCRGHSQQHKQGHCLCRHFRHRCGRNRPGRLVKCAEISTVLRLLPMPEE